MRKIADFLLARFGSKEAALFYCDSVIERYSLAREYESLLVDRMFFRRNISYWEHVKAIIQGL